MDKDPREEIARWSAVIEAWRSFAVPKIHPKKVSVEYHLVRLVPGGMDETDGYA